MTIGSLFSGVGGFDLGFQRVGFDTVWRCETEPFCRKVLTHKLAGPPIFGDVRAVGKSVAAPVDVLIGGFPCQDLSIAGQRRGFTGTRSSLFFEFVRLIRELRPRWWVIENVPGFLSSNRGFDFAVGLRELDACGYVGCWRVLDSQYFGLAQRRARVFLVGGLRGLRECAQTVLFESASRSGDSQASEKERTRVAAILRGRASHAGVNEPGRGGEDDENLVCFDWQSGGDVRLNCSSSSSSSSLQASQTPAVAIRTAQTSSNGHGLADDISYTLDQANRQAVAFTLPAVHRGVGNGHNTNYVAHTLSSSRSGMRFDPNGEDFIASPITASAGHHGHSSPRGDGRDNLVYALGSHSGTDGEVSNASHEQGGPVGLGISEEQANSLRSGRTQAIAGVLVGVRRLTPLECERLQGFPDGWTCLCGEGHRGSQFCTCKDTPRYKALGNAVSVPVAQWIAERIKAAEMIT